MSSATTNSVIKANSIKKDIAKASEFKFTKMAVFTRANGKTTNEMAKVSKSIKMIISTTVPI